MSSRGIGVATAALLALIGLGGCRFHSDHDKDVDIRTPLGSISVHKGANDPKATGLSLYPGAQIKQDLEDRDGGANVDISSSFFGLKVVALKYQSNDSPEKVLSFYKKDMAKYGNVVDCAGGFSLTFRRHSQDSEVNCDNHGGGHRYQEALKVGTEYNQRIVAIRPSGDGSEFALVYVKAWDEKTTM
jgi:outer membrane lipopolysaccharide assembly protein LptE/RlpB